MKTCIAKNIKALVIVLLLALLLSGMTVFAGQENDSFTLVAGASSSVTTARLKLVSNNRRLYVHPQQQNIYQPTQWPSGVTINFRGRTSTSNNATYLKAVSDPGDYYCTYYENSGYVGNSYRLATNLPSNSTCSTAYITAYWTP